MIDRATVADLLGRHELQRDRVDAVADVPGGELLAAEDVAEVAAAVGALDLGPPAVGVGEVFHRRGQFGVEGGPAAVRRELVLGAVEQRAAAPARVDAVLEEVVVLAGEGALGALVDDDRLLLGGEGRHLAQRREGFAGCRLALAGGAGAGPAAAREYE